LKDLLMQKIIAFSGGNAGAFELAECPISYVVGPFQEMLHTYELIAGSPQRLGGKDVDAFRGGTIGGAGLIIAFGLRGGFEGLGITAIAGLF
jgi:hypothetical protein